MDFELSQEQKIRWREIAAFAEAELSPGFVDRDHCAFFDHGMWKTASRQGFAGLPVPEKYGGRSLNALDTILAVEALGYGCRDGGLVFSLCAHMFTCLIPIWKAGNEEQRRNFLIPLARGEWIGGNASSEPETGSDVFALSTTAERKRDFYLLNGVKRFISNGPIADAIVLYATVDKESKLGGITAFILTKDCPGFAAITQQKLGLRTSPMSEYRLENCEIPVSQRLGPEGAGVGIFVESMRWERACLFGAYTGMMQRQLEQCLNYARKRCQFGQPIAKFQSISNKIVEMKLRLDAAKLLLYRAGWLMTQGRPCDMEISLSKLFISESAVQSSLDAIQIHGGAGILPETGLEQELRNSIPSRIYSGTSEVQRALIARYLGL
jgi:alkylation response protein AidB-like acyl-CoA dehydrogenase